MKATSSIYNSEHKTERQRKKFLFHSEQRERALTKRRAAASTLQHNNHYQHHYHHHPHLQQHQQQQQSSSQDAKPEPTPSVLVTPARTIQTTANVATTTATPLWAWILEMSSHGSTPAISHQLFPSTTITASASKQLTPSPQFARVEVIQQQQPSRLHDYYRLKLQQLGAKITAKYIDQHTGERLNRQIEDEKEEARQKALFAPRHADLDPVDERRVLSVLAGPPSQEVLIDKFNIDMTRSKFACLRPGTWLNDEVINFYMAMLVERDARLLAQDATRRPSFYFNSFFVSKLLEGNKYNYAMVKRWTKRFDVFEQEKIVFPVNLGNTHWTLAVVYLQQKKIVYHDSMSGSGQKQLDALMQWVIDEGREKKNITIDKREWILLGGTLVHTPQQRNGVDCGVFTVACADRIADNLKLEYSQDEMRLFRLKIGAAILNGSLPY
jgi:Ulp1 family protease